MKKCPYCAEQIQDEAIVCRYCGRELKIEPIKTQTIKIVIPKENKSLGHLLFSTEGRIPRSVYWGYSLILVGLFLVAYLIDIGSGLYDRELGWGIATGLLAFISFFTTIFVSIKRSHDVNKSGFFILVYLIPFVSLWPTIELAFIKGTKGTNQYGPAPC